LMYFAARRGNVEMMRWLLARRIAFDLASTAGTVQVGETPLFVAAHAGQLGALRVLADAGANMRHATECGDTPLRAAAREGYGDCVRFLLQRGVKPTRIDLEQCVEHAQSADALIELLAHGCTADSALLALLVRTDTVNPHAELTTNARKFMVLWHAGVLLGEVAMTSHITALARICGAVPPVDCSLGESCRDLTNEHQQLFFHKWQSAGETHLTADVFAFVDTVARKGVALVGDRAVQVLFGLQSLGLPALVSTIIIDCACPLATLVSMHLKWRLVTLVKHFKDEDNKNKNDKKRTK
jgi:hypothetical protein